jgi:hypothetical protein
LEDRIGFTAYFRCCGCGAGGPWDLPAETVLEIAVLSTEYLESPESCPLRMGAMRTFDGKPIRCPTEGERYLRELIAADPRDAYLWGRLGNLLHNSGQHDLAREAFDKAVELDPEEIEAHHSLGQIFEGDGALETSGYHFREVLRHAWKKKGDLDVDLLRGIVYDSLESLLELHDQTEGRVSVLPEPDPEELRAMAQDDVAVLEIREFDLSSERGREEMISQILRERGGGRSASAARLSRQRFRDVPDPLEEESWPPPSHLAAGRRGGDSRLLRPSQDQIRLSSPPPRNGPCPCGSGRKYKNCCAR